VSGSNLLEGVMAFRRLEALGLVTEEHRCLLELLALAAGDAELFEEARSRPYHAMDN
jgi:hypothetical protein